MTNLQGFIASRQLGWLGKGEVSISFILGFSDGASLICCSKLEVDKQSENCKLLEEGSEVCNFLIVNAAVLLSHASANVKVFVFWVTLRTLSLILCLNDKIC